MLISPTEGEVVLLGYMLSNNVKLHLYTAPTSTPTETITLADITEASDGSYAAITLNGGSWTISTDVVTSVTSGVYAQQTFNFSGSQTVYGYYVSQTSPINILWMEEFVNPQIFSSGGGTITIVPTLILGSGD